MRRLDPYLTFDGNCGEAFEFYRSVFGGDYGAVNRYSEMPEGSGVAPEDAQKLMHIALPIGGSMLMGSDRPPGTGTGTFGDAVSVMFTADSTEEGTRIFEALAAGGRVDMPFERQFWGADYGQLVDRFGIQWMVSFDPTRGGAAAG